MITLLLIRHGIAEEPRPGRRDCDRALTAEGWEKTRAAMRGLVLRGYVPVRGVASPFRRAAETLMCLKEATPDGFPVGYWEGLEPEGSCGMAEAWLMAQLSEAQPFDTLAVVAHQPFLSHLIRHLTGADVDMKKASCAVLHWNGGRFELAVHFSPAELRGQA
jgi:phosphohistidine phosphatase